jgi:hypothetical protein
MNAMFSEFTITWWWIALPLICMIAALFLAIRDFEILSGSPGDVGPRSDGKADPYSFQSALSAAEARMNRSRDLLDLERRLSRSGYRESQVEGEAEGADS